MKEVLSQNLNIRVNMKTRAILEIMSKKSKKSVSKIVRRILELEFGEIYKRT